VAERVGYSPEPLFGILFVFNDIATNVMDIYDFSFLS